MPTIQWIGSPNFTQGRQGHKPIGICDHIECGTEPGTESWFKNPAAQVSAHFSIGRDGSIHQYVNAADTAWAEGIVNRPTSPLWTQFNGVNPNLYLISIEHEGYPQDGLTELQYQSTLWLHRKLIAEHGIAVDATHITSHSAFDSVNRADCPGPKFPWIRLFHDLGQKGDTMPTLQIGSNGGDVVKLQSNLNTLLNITLATDGAYGPKTAAAVKSFQLQFHVSPINGVANPATLDAVQQAIAARPQPPVPVSQPTTPAPVSSTLADAQQQFLTVIEAEVAAAETQLTDVKSQVATAQSKAQGITDATQQATNILKGVLN